MRKFIICFMLSVFAVSAFSQDGVTSKTFGGFWDFSFGESKTSVLNKLKNYSKDIGEIDDDGEKVYLFDLVYNGIDFDTALLTFRDGKLLFGYFVAKPKDQDEAFKMLSGITYPLKEEYGIPEIETDGGVYHKWKDAVGSRIWVSIKGNKGETMITLSYYSSDM